jgi:membrane-bound lytic murein transglycosylase D
MNDRTKTFHSFFGLAIVVATAGCAVNQQARFQMAFFPPSSHYVADIHLDAGAAPMVQPNIYLADVPPIVRIEPLPPAKTRGDLLVERASRRLEAGKRYYQARDVENARHEFDAAIDLMLEASEHNPADRQSFEKRMDEMVDAIHRSDLAGLGSSAAVEDAKFEKAPLEDILQMTFPVDPKLKDRVRDQVAATVSQLPLAVNDTVLGYINYFAKRGHNTLVAAMERSGRYRPMIQRILEEEGLPLELIHLAQAESGFIPRAVSQKAAGGMWQFVKWRGQQYGLQQTRLTDDRMDPERATRAAAHHLHDLYNEFGDWYLAMAAYNCGPGVVERAVERTGFADFWELRSRGVLPLETTNYVPIILAITIMEKNAAEYGLEGLILDHPIEYDTVDVTAPTSMALVSDITETPASELAALNPAVLRGHIPSSYTLHVPKGTGDHVSAVLGLVPPEHRDSWRVHRLAADETLAGVGRRYGITPAAIEAANQLDSKAPGDGDLLLIPVRPVTATAAARTVAPVSRRPATASAARRPSAAGVRRTVRTNSTPAKGLTTSTSKRTGASATVAANTATR